MPVIHEAKIEYEEDGCYVYLSTDEGERTYLLDDPEQLYDAVKGGIGPWLRERDEAFREREAVDAWEGVAQDLQRAAYPVTDPRHPDHHSIHADLHDLRHGK